MMKCFVLFFNCCSHVQILSKCLQRFVFRNLNRDCMFAIWLFRMFQSERNVLTVDLFRFRLFAILMLFWSHMFWNVFHQNARSRIVYIDVFLFIILFDFQYFRIDFKMFSSKCSIRNCLYERRFFYNFIRFAIHAYWFWNVFYQNVWSETVSHEWRFFLFCETYNQNICFFVSMRMWFIKNN